MTNVFFTPLYKFTIVVAGYKLLGQSILSNLTSWNGDGSSTVYFARQTGATVFSLSTHCLAWLTSQNYNISVATYHAKQYNFMSHTTVCELSHNSRGRSQCCWVGNGQGHITPPWCSVASGSGILVGVLNMVDTIVSAWRGLCHPPGPTQGTNQSYG